MSRLRIPSKHDRVGRVEDGLGGAIVFYKFNHPSAFVFFLEIEKILETRALKAVDGLFFITNDKKVWILVKANEKLEQFILGVVGVLVLIGQHILVLFLQTQTKIFFLLE